MTWPRRPALKVGALIVAVMLGAGCGAQAPSAQAPTGRVSSAPREGSAPSSGRSSSTSKGGSATPPAASTAAPLPSYAPVSCPAATVTVHTADELTIALRAARPGASIHLTDRTYSGTFTAQTSGTAAQPIWLCGSRRAVLDGGGTGSGYGLHLNPAQHWRIVGFAIRNSQKGVMTDGTTDTVLQDLLVEQIGDEAIHLRKTSTANSVLRNTVRNTGLHTGKYGEGIYIGSAISNWATFSGGGPDRSDHNLVQDNVISNTTAESADIKEGTIGGALVDNTFDGIGMADADSWVDVKGNDWLIAGNVGVHTSKDGFQTHQVVDGWGAGNTFSGNTARSRGAGVDFYVHKADSTGNHLLCDNRSGSDRPASSNVACSS